MTKTNVGLAIALAFVAGMRLAQGDPGPLPVALWLAVYALNEKRINAKSREWAMRFLRRLG